MRDPPGAGAGWERLPPASAAKGGLAPEPNGVGLGRRGGARERTEGWPAKRPSRWEWTLARRRRRPLPLPRRCRRNNHLPGSHPASGVGASFSVPLFTSPRPRRGMTNHRRAPPGPAPIFCALFPRPRPRRGRGQNLPEAQRKGWYPDFCVPSPRPPPPEGAGARSPDVRRRGWYPGIQPFVSFSQRGYQMATKNGGKPLGP